MFWHAWLAFHQQRHPYVSWHLCGPRALHNRIWEHKSSTILFSSVQYNSTDRVRCHPWSALIFWNAKTKQYAWPPSTFPMDPAPFVFHHIPENYHTHPAEPLDSLSFLAKMAWNAIVCETTGVSGGNSIFPIFQNTWFQTILAKKRKKNVENVSFTEYEDFMECTDLAECDDLTVWVPPQLWSAMPSLECEKIVECEEFRVCVAGI